MEIGIVQHYNSTGICYFAMLIYRMNVEEYLEALMKNRE